MLRKILKLETELLLFKITLSILSESFRSGRFVNPCLCFIERYPYYYISHPGALIPIRQNRKKLCHFRNPSLSLCCYILKLLLEQSFLEPLFQLFWNPVQHVTDCFPSSLFLWLYVAAPNWYCQTSIPWILKTKPLSISWYYGKASSCYHEMNRRAAHNLIANMNTFQCNTHITSDAHCINLSQIIS